MIEPARDVIFVRFDNGRAEPLALEELAARIVENEGPRTVEPWVAEQIARAIFHYLRVELHRNWVTSGELYWILRAAIEGLAEARKSHPQIFPSPADPPPNPSLPSTATRHIVEADLHQLALECGGGFELAFFDSLGALVGQIQQEHPALIRFVRLRPCVKTIIGAQLWSRACQRLNDEILAFIRARFSKLQARHSSVLLIV